jgi:hypothetical protein
VRDGIGSTARECAARQWEDELDWLENQQDDGFRCLVCDVALLSFWALLTAAAARFAMAAEQAP